MSGIYILKTKNEFRVAYNSEFYDFLAKYDDDMMDWTLNSEEIAKIFNTAPIFNNFSSALDMAVQISKKYTETTDGIFEIRQGESLNYEEIVNGSYNRR
jgi:hypothetical protein